MYDPRNRYSEITSSVSHMLTISIKKELLTFLCTLASKCACCSILSASLKNPFPGDRGVCLCGLVASLGLVLSPIPANNADGDVTFGMLIPMPVLPLTPTPAVPLPLALPVLECRAVVVLERTFVRLILLSPDVEESELLVD